MSVSTVKAYISYRIYLFVPYGTGAVEWYKQMIESFTKKHSDILLQQKVWDRDRRLTYMFVVDEEYLDDFVNKLNRVLMGAEIKVITSGGPPRVYVYISKVGQFSRRSV